ncbi:MAG: hypothetical protein ABIP55_16235, partial [Tepidisphaeraceae bacterium]
RMSLSAAATARGDQQEAEDQAAKAAAIFQLALEHYSATDPGDKNMTTGSLREERLKALLVSRNYQDATRFASESIAANASNQDRMGVKLKKEVDTLQTAGKLAEALKLIESINRMNPKLAGQYLDPINDFERQIRDRAATPRSSAGNGT